MITPAGGEKFSFYFVWQSCDLVTFISVLYLEDLATILGAVIVV